MKKGLVLACSAMALTIAMSSAAEARDGFYLTARGGMAWNHLNSKKDSVTTAGISDLDSVGTYGGAIGYKYKYFRGELEYVWRDDAEEEVTFSGIHISDMSVNSESYMFNLYFDFMPNYWISPYISAGLGMSKLEMTHTEPGASGQSTTWEEDKFTWQVGGGLTIRINRCLNIDGGYRYYTLGKIENAEINTHEWYAGIRFTF